MKILNLYACLGGNRYKWDEVTDVDVTAVELDTELARLSKKELKKVIRQYEKAQTSSKELQRLKKKSQDLAVSLLGKTTAANNLKRLSTGVINNKHILK